jgi:hypothetical protein
MSRITETAMRFRDMSSTNGWLQIAPVPHEKLIRLIADDCRSGGVDSIGQQIDRPGSSAQGRIP